jgi:hypothetical protein
MNYDQNDCQRFSFITPLFPTLANTLKIKVGDVVCCIFDVECRLDGFLILKQIIIPGDQEGLFKLAIQLRTFFIRLFTTLQPDVFCGFI